MKKKIIKNMVPLLGVALFLIAVLVLHHELRKYPYHDIIRHLKELPAERLFLGLALTALSYYVLTGYDTLSMRYIKRPLGYARTAFAAFAGYAFSHNMGFSFISGGSVRYRLYSGWGLSAGEVTRVVVFNGVTYWLGFCAMEGISFLADPPAFLEPLKLGPGPLRSLGALLTAAAFGYLAFNAFRKKPVRVREWKFPMPSLSLSISQLVISSADWAIASGVLFVLLPHVAGLTFFKFLSIYLMAQGAGLFSHVPGGLGVFEMVVVLFLSPMIPAPVVVGSILAYRGIYYLLPLCAATVLFGSYEALQKKRR